MCTLDADAWGRLAGGVRDSTTLHSFAVKRSFLHTDLRVFCAALRENRSLLGLRIAVHHADEEMVDMLYEYLATTRTLQTLELAHVVLETPACAARLVAGLARCRSLTALTVKDINFGAATETDALAVMAELKLSELRLIRIPLARGGLSRLLCALPGHPTLRTLALRDMWLTPVEFVRLARGIESSGLTTLDIRGVRSNDTLKCIRTLFSSFPRLECMILSAYSSFMNLETELQTNARMCSVRYVYREPKQFQQPFLVVRICWIETLKLSPGF